MNNKPTAEQCEAVYHCGIGEILTAAYQREFTMMEMGKCKTKYPTFKDWYATLNETQRQRVDRVLVMHYRSSLTKILWSVRLSTGLLIFEDDGCHLIALSIVTVIFYISVKTAQQKRALRMSCVDWFAAWQCIGVGEMGLTMEGVICCFSFCRVKLIVFFKGAVVSSTQATQGGREFDVVIRFLSE